MSGAGQRRALQLNSGGRSKELVLVVAGIAAAAAAAAVGCRKRWNIKKRRGISQTVALALKRVVVEVVAAWQIIADQKCASAMSNLWFFRLKRAEQQRRRSSGEQSVGGASLQSATGISAASLPVTSIPSNQQPLDPLQQQQQQLCFSGADYYESPTNDWPPDDHHLVADTCRMSNNEQLMSGHETRLRASRNGVSGAGSSSSRVANRDQGRRNEDQEGEEVLETSAKGNWQSPVEGSRCSPMAQISGPTTMAVPQVTIIRSDSTSSFLQVSDQPAVEPAVQPAPSASVQARPLVSKWNAAKGSAESECIDWPDKSDSKAGSSAQQATSGSSGSISQRVKRRGLHDQLISGQVPPIQDKRLLNPGGKPSLADSMDNLAALIPR